MSNTPKSNPDPGQSFVYEIRIKGHLDPRWTDWFEGMSIASQASGDTLLTGQLVDQAALHGLLKKVRDVGLPLLSIIRIEPELDAPEAQTQVAQNVLERQQLLTPTPTNGSTANHRKETE